MLVSQDDIDDIRQRVHDVQYHPDMSEAFRLGFTEGFHPEEQDTIIASTACALAPLTAHLHDLSRQGGWYNDRKTGEPIERNVGEMMALIHTEISEGLEAYRKDRMDDHLPHRSGVEVEMADAIIRICDLAGYLNLDLAGALAEKALYNRARSDHQPAARAAAGGKKF